MMPRGTRFGLTLSNIPIANLRGEFHAHSSLIADEGFRQRVREGMGPLETPYLVWFGMPGEFLTLLVVRAILGIESYLPFAVIEAAADRGCLTPDLAHRTRHPFSLARSTVGAYYNGLPSLVDHEYSLEVAHPEQWQWMKAFYKEVRNPLLHGCEIDFQEIDRVADLFKGFEEVYRWVDRWSPPSLWASPPRTQRSGSP